MALFGLDKILKDQKRIAAEYQQAELIPRTKENYLKVLKFIYAERIFPPKKLLLMFLLCYPLFGLLLIKKSVIYAALSWVGMVAVFIVLLPPLWVLLTYVQASRIREKGSENTPSYPAFRFRPTGRPLGSLSIYFNDPSYWKD